jgi:hypothetical protein
MVEMSTLRISEDAHFGLSAFSTSLLIFFQIFDLIQSFFFFLIRNREIVKLDLDR